MADAEYLRLLRKISEVMRGMLDLRFDWDERERIVFPAPFKRSLFGKKLPSDEEMLYEQLKVELASLQKQAKRLVGGTKSGASYWWATPWQTLEECLLFDLAADTISGNWQFEETRKSTRNGETTTLFVIDHGHLSGFSTSKSVTEGIVSAYGSTQADMDEIRRKYRSKQADADYAQAREDDYELRAHNTLRVYTGANDVKYGTFGEYMKTSEYWAKREMEADNYVHSLYETKTSTTYTARSSGGADYFTALAAAEYAVNSSGELTMIQPLYYKVCSDEDGRPGDRLVYFGLRDSAVDCCAFLDRSREVSAVPVRLFFDNEGQEAHDAADALMQAEMITCLADKIKW